MMNRKRRSALLLCLGFVLVLLVSSAFMIHEADHDCCGSDCSVCRMIAVQASLMRLSGLALLALLVIAALQGLRHTHMGAVRLYLPLPDTLVHRKIRLND